MPAGPARVGAGRPRFGGQRVHQRMLRRQHQVRGAEQGVGAGGEYPEHGLFGGEVDVGTLGAADPVPLHGRDMAGPLQRVEPVQQPVGIRGDPEEPLLHLARLHLGAASLAAVVGHLLVGQDCLVVRAPVDRRVPSVGQAGGIQLQEDPLRPAVVGGIVRADLPAPVDRQAPALELRAERRDRLVGGRLGMPAGPDRMVLCGQAERVIAHRVQDVTALAPPVVRHGVAHGVVLEVADVRLAAGVRQLLEDVGAVPAGSVVGDLPGALGLPYALPSRLDLVRVEIVEHGKTNCAGSFAAHRPHLLCAGRHEKTPRSEGLPHCRRDWRQRGSARRN